MRQVWAPVASIGTFIADAKHTGSALTRLGLRDCDDEAERFARSQRHLLQLGLLWH
jgi:hypothetical protein